MSSFHNFQYFCSGGQQSTEKTKCQSCCTFHKSRGCKVSQFSYINIQKLDCFINAGKIFSITNKSSFIVLGKTNCPCQCNAVLPEKINPIICLQVFGFFLWIILINKSITIRDRLFCFVILIYQHSNAKAFILKYLGGFRPKRNVYFDFRNKF